MCCTTRTWWSCTFDGGGHALVIAPGLGPAPRRHPGRAFAWPFPRRRRRFDAQHRADRKSTRLNSSHTVISTLSLHDALPIWGTGVFDGQTVTREHVLHDKDVVELHV